jgi:hypothetical protein
LQLDGITAAQILEVVKNSDTKTATDGIPNLTPTAKTQLLADLFDSTKPSAADPYKVQYV